MNSRRGTLSIQHISIINNHPSQFCPITTVIQPTGSFTASEVTTLLWERNMYIIIIIAVITIISYHYYGFYYYYYYDDDKQEDD